MGLIKTPPPGASPEEWDDFEKEAINRTLATVTRLARVCDRSAPAWTLVQ